jgi:two-component system sensor histidine kinase YesM
MFQKKKEYKYTILFKLITIMLFGLLPIYVAGVIIYQIGISSIKEEITVSAKSQVDYLLNSMEVDFENIRMLEYEITNDPDLNQLASIPESMDPAEKALAINRVVNRLNVLKIIGGYAKEVNVHIPAIGYTLSSNGSGVEPLNQERYMMNETLKEGNYAKVIYKDGNMLIFAGDLLTTISTEISPQYLIEVELSKNALQNALIQFSNQNDSGAIIINSENNFIISSDQNEEAEISLQIKADLLDKVKKKSEDVYSIDIKDKTYMVLYSSSADFEFTLCKFIPVNQAFSGLERYQYVFWAFSILALIIIGLYSRSFYSYIHQPLSKLSKAFLHLEEGNFEVSIKHQHNDEFQNIYSKFNNMVEKLKVLIDQIYKQKILAQRAELKQLQTQINPHFLYNSFFILHRMIVGDENENAAVFSKQLGNYFKYVTRSAADEVKLSYEIEHAQIYCNIQGLRFKNRMSIHFDELPKEIEDLSVPRLIIQPLIENAVEHGLKDIEENGLVYVKFNLIENGFTISVEDNGDGISDKELEELQSLLSSMDETIECTGVLNIHRRLRLKYGSGSGISVSKNQWNGFTAQITIQGGEQL